MLGDAEVFVASSSTQKFLPINQRNDVSKWPNWVALSPDLARFQFNVNSVGDVAGLNLRRGSQEMVSLDRVNLSLSPR